MIERLIGEALEKTVDNPQMLLEKELDDFFESVEIEPTEQEKAEITMTKWFDSVTMEDQLEDMDNTDSTENSETDNGEKPMVDNSEQIEKLLKEYLGDLNNNSEYPDTIECDEEPYEKLSPEETAEKRAEFNANKEKLIIEWEEKNGKEWPRYKEDVYVNGKLIRKAGDRYDAHHIHPLSLGGKNESSNITPISAEKHFDKQGVHASDSPYGKLEKTLQEAKLQ